MGLFFQSDKKPEETERFFLSSALRSSLVAIAVAAALPMIDTNGIVITNLICAILVWISFGYVIPFSFFFGKENFFC